MHLAGQTDLLNLFSEFNLTFWFLGGLVTHILLLGVRIRGRIRIRDLLMSSYEFEELFGMWTSVLHLLWWCWYLCYWVWPNSSKRCTEAENLMTKESDDECKRHKFSSSKLTLCSCTHQTVYTFCLKIKLFVSKSGQMLACLSASFHPHTSWLIFSHRGIYIRDDRISMVWSFEGWQDNLS